LERISIVINRFDPKNSLKIEDMKSIVNHDKVYVIPNEFDLVTSTSNMGVPLCESMPKSKIAQDLKRLAKNLGNVELEGERKNLLVRLRSLFP
jgi:pilus assembly protein CpaE